MYDLTDPGNSLKVAEIEDIFEKARLLQIAKWIDSTNNNQPLFDTKLVSTF